MAIHAPIRRRVVLSLYLIPVDLGPVGSRQRKVEAELLQQQQHTSNTWPFLQEFGRFPADNAGGNSFAR